MANRWGENKMYDVGILGNGFVGSSIASGLALHANVKIHDPNPDRSLNTFEEVVDCDFVFVSVPTPMNLSKNNEIDLSVVREVFSSVNTYKRRNKDSNQDSIFVLKSTVVPGTTDYLQELYPNLKIVFNPEFLTERSAKLDFINTSRVVIGGEEGLCDKLEDLYRVRFPHTLIIKTDTKSAEFIKYMCNCFFATKISFMNEMKQASNLLDLNWESVMKGFLSDGRIGNSHVDVPGHDGSLGFGGKCFPKDVNAFMNFLEKEGVKTTMLTAAWEKNQEVRDVHDWLDIEGATSK